ncbi:MAG: prephenate dehydratase [Alicyclobacillus sp.]|nr:prephenate dehydratase [Alicyclobacillus sp.]
MRVSYLGPAGTFSEAAAIQYFGNQTVSRLPCTTILDALEAVHTGGADLAIVPIENSIEGAVNMTLDGLLIFDDLFVSGEYVLPVTQHLLAIRPDIAATALTEVWSHPQAIGQCRQYLRRLGVQTKTFASTAAAAEAVAEAEREDVAAIAPAWAAASAGLYRIADEIQDNPENHTRFVIVRRADSDYALTVGNHEPQRPFKTMLVVTPAEEHAGVLASMLNVFAALSINLTWIESRPTKRRLGTYQFFLDAEGKHDAPPLQKASTILSTLGHDVRVLGSYPKAAPPHAAANSATEV